MEYLRLESNVKRYSDYVYRNLNILDCKNTTEGTRLQRSWRLKGYKMALGKDHPLTLTSVIG